MAQKIACGIDVGTYEVKIVISERAGGSPGSTPKIIGTGKARSSGLRHGYIINVPDIVKSIKQAASDAEKMAGVKIDQAFLSLGGISLDSSYSIGQVTISRADNEITELDLARAQKSAEDSLPQSFTMNQRIIHRIPISHKINGQDVLGNPVGMKGMRLDTKVLFVSCLEGHLNDLVGAVEEAGIEVSDIMASPIAASLPILSKTQKVAGCVLANIGAETVSIVVYENDIPISVKVFPIGSTDITNDIALGLQIDIEEAEKLKLTEETGTKVSKKKLNDIIEARLTDIFELIDNHLKKVGKSELLPAGIIITGGGSGLSTIEDVAKALLKIPSRRASINPRLAPSRVGVKDATWAVAYGMTIFALEPGDVLSDRGIEVLKKTRTHALSWIKRFLP
jgi:cell division protein FtsA